MLEATAISLAAVINYCLKSVFVLSFALLIGSLIRHKSASAQHAFWLLSLIAAAAAPLLSVIVPRINIRFGAGRLLSDDPFWTTLPGSDSAVWTPPGVALLLIIYLAGMAALAIWMLAGRIYAHRIRRDASPAERADITRMASGIAGEFGIRRKIEILISGRINSPLVIGITRPAVILPDTMRYWPENILRSALAHELAHIKRRDLLSKAVAYFCCCLTWFNPLAWLIKHKMLREQEFACDARAAESFAQASEYARNLLQTAAAHRYAMGGSVAGMGLSGNLVERLKEILKPQREKGSARLKHLLAAIFVTLVLLTPIAALNLIATRINSDDSHAATLSAEDSRRVPSNQGINPDNFMILEETEDSISIAFKLRR